MNEYVVSYYEEVGKVVTVFAKSAEEAQDYVADKLEQGEEPAYIGHNETVHRDFGIVETVEVSNEK